MKYTPCLDTGFLCRISIQAPISHAENRGTAGNSPLADISFTPVVFSSLIPLHTLKKHSNFNGTKHEDCCEEMPHAMVLLIFRASHLETLTAHSSHHCLRLPEKNTKIWQKRQFDIQNASKNTLKHSIIDKFMSKFCKNPIKIRPKNDNIFVQN